MTVNYWFLSSYLVLCFSAPLLNMVIANMDKKKHALLCIAGFLLICVYYTTNPFINEMIYVGHSRGIVWFFYLYFVSAYIKKYDIKIKNGVLISVLILLFLMMSAITMVGKTIFGNLNILGNYSILPFLSSVLIFLLFKDLKINLKWLQRMIVCLAECSFYVYIIQEHDAIRNWYWSIFTDFEKWQDLKMIIYLLASVIALWPMAYIINKIVKIFNPIVEKLYKLVEKKVGSFFYK